MAHHHHPHRRPGALALVAVAALGGISACGGHDADSRTARAADAGSAAKTLDGAKAAAQTVFERFAGGDYAGAWEMYTTAGTQAISEDDYVKLNEACSRRGVAIQLTSARLATPDRAIVIARQLEAAQSYTMVYETDSWRLEPAKEGLALYRLGAAKAIAAQRKAGTCGGQ